MKDRLTGSHALDNLDAATLAHLDGRQGGPVEGVGAVFIFVAVAFKTLELVAG